jgi:hypothetical protein
MLARPVPTTAVTVFNMIVLVLGLLLMLAHGKTSSDGVVELDILLQDEKTGGSIRLTEGDVLNLTCVVSDGGGGDHGLELRFVAANEAASRQGRLSKGRQKEGSVRNIVIAPVQKIDAGDYKCEATHKGATVRREMAELEKVLKVRVDLDSGSCPPGQYQCRDGHCIPVRYRCDGVPDCLGLDDESYEQCGVYDPCDGKISCPELDNRCFDPAEFCCDPQTDNQCRVFYPCCKAVLDFNFHKKYGNFARRKTEKDSFAYLHSTVYTVIGCAVGFIVLVLVLTGVICRLHVLKTSRATPRGAGRSHPPITLHDLDLYFSERRAHAAYHAGGDITYNINHGVQILDGGGSQPPPYSAGRGPPPPYISTENLAPGEQQQQPLIGDMEEDDNNNGDINGNSEMVDNNVNIVDINVNMAGNHVNMADDINVNMARLDPGTPPPRYPGLNIDTSTDSDED